MFRSSRPLIATPTDRKRGKALEFTPIGKSKGNNENMDPRGTTKKHIPSTIRRNPLDRRGSNHNSINGGSSFIQDDSFDTLRYSDKPTKTSSSPIPNDFDKHALLNNGSNPLLQQQENVSKLKDENYNLKVKIASLTRFLNSVTNNEQQEIYKQNSELQEKLIEVRGELAYLKQELADGKNDHRSIDTSSLNQEIERLNSLVEDLKNQSKHDDDQIMKLQKTIDELQKSSNDKLQNDKTTSRSYVDRVEELNEELKSTLEDANYELKRKDEELDEKDERIEALETKLTQISNRSAVSTDRDVEKIDQLEEEIKNKDFQINKLTKQLNSQDQMIHSLQKKVKTSVEELNDKEKVIGSMDKDLRNLENNKFTKMSQQIEQLNNVNEKYVSSIKKLQDKIGDYKDIIEKQKKIIRDFETNGASYEAAIRKIDILENQSRLTEKEMNSLKAERDVLLKQLDRSDQELIALKDNSERTYKSYQDLKKRFDSYQRAKSSINEDKLLKEEVENLNREIKDLNLENTQLNRDLEKQKSFKQTNMSSYDKQELRNLSSKCNDLQMELSEKDFALSKLNSQHKKDLERYKSALEEREEEIIKTKEQLKSLKLQNIQQLDDQNLELLKLKNSKENQIKLLQIELLNLKEQHENELRSYKNLLNKSKVNSFPINDGSLSNDDLLKKVEDKNIKIRYLNSKILEFTENVKEMEMIITRLKDKKMLLSDENAKLETKIEELADQVREYKNQLAATSYKNIVSEDFEILKQKLKSKEKELNSVNNEFDAMKSDLVNKYRETQNDKVNLQRKIDKLMASYNQMQSLVNNSKSMEQISELELRAELYRMKYNKSSYIIRDLQFVNEFMTKSILSTNAWVKDDIKKLQRVGIYPDYELICKKRPSLKILIKFVIAAVRIKRKTEYSRVKTRKLNELKTKLVELK